MVGQWSGVEPSHCHHWLEFCQCGLGLTFALEKLLISKGDLLLESIREKFNSALYGSMFYNSVALLIKVNSKKTF